MSKNRIKMIFSITAIFICLIVVFTSCISIFIINKTKRYVATSENLPDDRFDCILVLGAGIKANGEPSDMLRDRLKTAIYLYKTGYSNTVVLSGDRSSDDYDEVRTMKNYCLSNGVLEQDIVCDTKGYSTYESIDNLKKLSYFDKIIIVTQSYHLYRAIYIADVMGFEAYGVSADLRNYMGQFYREAREGVARIKDLIKVNILK